MPAESATNSAAKNPIEHRRRRSRPECFVVGRARRIGPPMVVRSTTIHDRVGNRSRLAKGNAELRIGSYVVVVVDSVVDVLSVVVEGGNVEVVEVVEVVVEGGTVVVVVVAVVVVGVPVVVVGGRMVREFDGSQSRFAAETKSFVVPKWFLLNVARSPACAVNPKQTR